MYMYMKKLLNAYLCGFNQYIMYMYLANDILYIHVHAVH